jgi:hypothetical protein
MYRSGSNLFTRIVKGINGAHGYRHGVGKREVILTKYRRISNNYEWLGFLATRGCRYKRIIVLFSNILTISDLSPIIQQ